MNVRLHKLAVETSLLKGPLHYFQVLEALLPKDMIIPSAFETVGHIAHLNLRDEHLPYNKLIAKVS